MKSNRKKIIPCLVFCFILKILSPDTALAVTAKQEEEMGHEFMRAVSRQIEFIKDPFIVEYVNKIGNKIVSVLPPQLFKYHFYVIKEDVYNAFAGPGGHVCINSGLFNAMDDEEELAGILAHEIAHVKCRHISQRIERSSKIGMLTLAGLAAGILLGATGSGDAASAITVGSAAAGRTIALAYSRENEMQADEIGLKYLAKAGYSGKGLLTMLKKIRSKQWFGSDMIPTYLTTHPAVEDRISYIAVWLNSDMNPGINNATINPLDFESAQTRLLVQYGDESSILSQFKEELEKNPSNPLSHYRYGLILDKIGDRKKAVNHLLAALEKKALDPYILKDLGRIYFNDGRYSESFKTLKGVVSIIPEDPEACFLFGRTALKLNKFEEAASILEKLILTNPDNKLASYYLGEAYGKAGKLGKAHFYLGVYYLQKREFKNAIFHLNKALNNLNEDDKKKKAREMLKKIRKNR